MSTPFQPIEIPPGVVAMGTKKMRSSNWAEVNFLRWREGQLTPMGGQAQLTNVVNGVDQYRFASRCKRIHGWYDLAGTYHIAYLCEANLYVDTGGTLVDITPSNGITPPAGLVGGYSDGLYSRNVLLNAAAAWTTSSTTITMPTNPGSVVPGHGVYNVTQSAYVGVVSTYVGGLLTLTAAAASAGNAGDVLDFDWYGKQRAVSASVAITKVPDAYSLDNFGSILYAMTSSDSRLLMWDPSQGTPGNFANLATTAAFVTTSPNITMVANPGGVTPGMSVYNLTTKLPVGTVLTYTGTALVLTANALNAGASGNVLAFGNVAVVQPASSGAGPVPHGRCFVVTQERFIMIFGSTQDGTTPTGGSSRRFAWCDQENPGAWDYSNVTSQAGFLDIEPASPIIAAIETRNGVLIWTAKKAYVSQFLGLPYVYNYVELSDACTPWSPQSMETTSSLTLWFAEQGLFSFDGTSILPVACPVRPWIDDSIDPIQVRELAFAAHLGEFNEFWWFHPTLGSTFNTQAAVYNYKEGWWTQCRLSRSAGITSSYTSHPIFADDYVAFQHEVGSTYANFNMPVVLPYAETFDLSLTSGARLTTVKQLLPDVEAVDTTDPTAIANAIGSLLYSLFYRNSRSLGAPELQSTPVPVRSDGYVDLRTTGRDIRLRIDVATPVIQPFTLGQHLIDAVPRGDR